MAHPYVRGRAFEYRVRDHLKEQGFFVVRQAKSSFPDFVALRKGEVLLIECRIDGKLSKSERASLKLLCEKTGARGLVAWRKGRRLLFRNLYPSKEER